MNIADLTHLHKAISEGSIPQHLKKQLIAFDDVVYATLPENVKPSKSLLLDNLRPGSLDYMIKNHNLTIDEIAKIINLLPQMSWGDSVFKYSSEFSFLIEQIKSSIGCIGKEEFIKVYQNSILFDLVAENIYPVEKYFQLSRLIDIDFTSLKNIFFLANKFKYSPHANMSFFNLNIIWSLTQCSDEQIISIFEEENLKLISNALIMTWELKESLPFMASKVLTAFWEKMNSSECFADNFLKCDIFVVKSNSSLSKRVQVAFFNDMLALYKKNKSESIRKYLVFLNELNFEQLIEAGIPVNYLEYSFANDNFEDFVSLENLTKIKSDKSICVEHAVFSKLMLPLYKDATKEYDANKEFWLNEIYVLCDYLLNENQCDIKIRMNVLNLIINSDFIEIELDKFNNHYEKEGESANRHVVELLKSKDSQNNYAVSLLSAKFLQKIVNWQNANPLSTSIQWRQVYENFYAMSSDSINLFPPELIKEISKCSLRMLSLTPAFLNLHFMQSQSEDSLRWLCYSPDSPLVNEILDKTTFNGTVINLKLTLRKMLPVACEDGSLHEALVLASKFNNAFKCVFEKIIGDELKNILRSYKFSTNDIAKDGNVFQNPLSSYSNDDIKTLSYYPLFDDMLIMDLNNLSNTHIANIVYAHAEYIPEEFCDFIFEKKLYLNPSYPSFNSILTLCDSVLSFKMADNLRKQAFLEVFEHNVNNPGNKHDWHSCWNLFFEYSVVEDYLKNKQIITDREKETLKEYQENIKRVIKISSELNVSFWQKEKFKRTIPFLSSSFLCENIISCNSLMLNKEVIKEQLERVHTSLVQTMMDSLLEQLKYMNFESREKIACFMGDVLNEQHLSFYLNKMFDTYPELLLSDTLNSSIPMALPNYLNEISLKEVCHKVEVGINGDALSFEVYLHDYLRKLFQISLCDNSKENIEAFKAHPAGFSMLVLLPFLSNQNASSKGWSLGLNEQNAIIFMTGLKIIIDKLVLNNNTQSKVVLNSVFNALKNGGVTFELVKKQLLIFLRDNHLYLYLNALAEFGDCDTIDFLYNKFQRALIEQQIEMFEAFVFSIKVNKSTKSKVMILDLEDIYRDVIVTDAYNILYHFFNEGVSDINEAYFFRNKLKEFIKGYTTYIKDLYYYSSRNFPGNEKYFENVLIPISIAKVDSICLGKKINMAIYTEDSMHTDEDFFKVDKI